MQTKKCSTCKEEKTIKDFYRLNSSKDGKQGRCKICQKDANKKSRAKRPKKVKNSLTLSSIVKLCRACEESKSVDLFYKNSKTKDGLFPKCKKCVDNKVRVKQTPLVVDGMKKCTKCSLVKPVDCFYTSKKEKCGYRSECIGCKLLYGKLYENKSEYRKNYRDNTKEYTLNYNKKYYEENKEKLIKKGVEYNRKFSKKRNDRHKKRVKEDVIYKASLNIRSLIQSSFKRKRIKKGTKTHKILGCSFKEFKEHIEKQFLPWMNWDNIGVNTGEYGEKWQLDHIIPSCNAKTEEEVYLLNHWSNFQPLCSKLNNEKGCDVNPVSNLELNISIIEDKNIIKNEEIKFAGSIYK